MCITHDDNRVDLLNLLINMQNQAFSVEELVEKFKKDKEDISIDGQKSIAKILKELAELGVLNYRYGKYSLAS